MAYFQTKNHNLGKFWRVKVGEVGKIYGHSGYFTAIWYIMGPFGIFYGYFCIFPVLVGCAKKNLAILLWSTLVKKKTFLLRKCIKPEGLIW
jgi:hypothetical protein